MKSYRTKAISASSHTPQIPKSPVAFPKTRQRKIFPTALRNRLRLYQREETMVTQRKPPRATSPSTKSRQQSKPPSIVTTHVTILSHLIYTITRWKPVKAAWQFRIFGTVQTLILSLFLITQMKLIFFHFYAINTVMETFTWITYLLYILLILIRVLKYHIENRLSVNELGHNYLL
jgi:hypothetical protein